MTKKRIGTMAACLALVGAVAVGGTLALLTSNTEDLQNTFAVGMGYNENNGLKLDEATVTQEIDGSYVATDTRTEEGVNYSKLVDGTTIDKDPTVTVKANSPDSWVVAYITNVDEAFANSDFAANNTLWYAVTKSGDNWDVADTPVANSDITAGYYIYKNIVPTSGTATELPDLFEKLSVDLTPEDGAAITQVDNMDIKACAIQAVGYDMLEGVITTDATNLNQAELNEIMNSLPADFTNPVA